MNTEDFTITPDDTKKIESALNRVMPRDYKWWINAVVQDVTSDSRGYVWITLLLKVDFRWAKLRWWEFGYQGFDEKEQAPLSAIMSNQEFNDLENKIITVFSYVVGWVPDKLRIFSTLSYGHSIEMDIDEDELLQHLKSMDFSKEAAKYELRGLIKQIKLLPDTLELYRIVHADKKADVNIKTPGAHYSLNKKELLDSHTHASGYGEQKFLLTVLAKKELIDIQQTLINNILYPNENEVTLKNGGSGVKIKSITNLTPNINESVEDNATPKDNSKRSLVIAKLVNMFGVGRAMEFTGLSVAQIFNELDKDIHIDSKDADTLLYLMLKNNELPKSYGNFVWEYNDFDGVLYWRWEKDGEIIDGAATPFWEDFPGIPIEGQVYYRGDYEGDLFLHENVKTQYEFIGIEDLRNWFINVFIPTLVKTANVFLGKFREEARMKRRSRELDVDV